MAKTEVLGIGELGSAFRELKTDGHGEKPIEENDLRALLRASRPLGPLVREVYGMPAPAKKHGNR